MGIMWGLDPYWAEFRQHFHQPINSNLSPCDYKWRLIKQSNVNHYLAPCGKIEYLLDCVPCGRSPPWPRPYHGRFFLVLFIVCRRTCWATFLANISGQAREQPELL